MVVRKWFNRTFWISVAIFLLIHCLILPMLLWSVGSVWCYAEINWSVVKSIIGMTSLDCSHRQQWRDQCLYQVQILFIHVQSFISFYCFKILFTNEGISSQLMARFPRSFKLVWIFLLLNKFPVKAPAIISPLSIKNESYDILTKLPLVTSMSTYWQS